MSARAEKVSSAAIRIPEQADSNPKLFIDEHARQALERKFRLAYAGRAVVLSVTDNRHRMITSRPQAGVMFVRLHHMFLAAAPSVTDALVRYLLDDNKPDLEAGRIVDEYIAANGAQKAKTRPTHAPYPSKGDHHDLVEIYETLNERYFDNQVQALIAWGRYSPRKKNQPRKTIRLGQYFQPDQLIRIHPVLDNSWVPRYFISDVVHHEMLHAIYDWNESDVRRCIHPPEMLEQEKQFRWHTRAITWQERNLNRLLRWG